MFKKLKIKLTLLNLAVAGIILIGIAMIAFILISDNTESQAQQSLEMFAGNFAAQQGSVLPGNIAFVMKAAGDFSPYYYISIDSDYQVQASLNVPFGSDEILSIAKTVLSDPRANKFISQPSEGRLFTVM